MKPSSLGDAGSRTVILSNRIQCRICGEIIESVNRHDFVSCRCGACSVDGGHDYLRRSYKSRGCFIELSVTEERPGEVKEGKN